MMKTILFATDLSVHTPYLLHHVNSIADEHRARIIVVHAIEPLGYMADAMVETYVPIEAREELESEGIERIIANIKAHIFDVLEDQFMDGHQGLACVDAVRVVAGKPTDVIIDESQLFDADMIVVGSHGQNTVTPHMLGSVTSKLLQRSRVPVYMVPVSRNVLYQAKAS